MRTMADKTMLKTGDDYLDLVRAFPLRPIAGGAEHKHAMTIINRLTPAASTGRLSAGQADYLAALGRFVADFEEKQLMDWPRARSGANPIDVLQHLMEERSMTSADLGDVLGSRPAASMILKGRREMSKSHIRVLAAYFHVSPAVFF